MTPEKRVQNKIINYLKSLQQQNYPLFYERRQAGGFSYKKGMPDIYVVYKGIHIEIEVKKPGGEMSSMQYKQKEVLEKAGGIYILAEDVKDVIEYFTNEKKSLNN